MTKEKKALNIYGLKGEIAGIYVFVMLVVFPLYVSQGYEGLFSGKWNLFLLSSTVLCAVGAAFMLYSLGIGALKKQAHTKWSIPDYMAAAYLLIALISYAGAYDRQAAFLGVSTWNMGLLSQILFVLVYFCISRSYEKSAVTELLAGGAYVVVCGIMLLQRLGFDPFGWYKGYGMEVKLNFLTTLGQVTWGSVYITVILAICIGWFAGEENRIRRSVLGGLIMIGFCALLIQNCDSGIMAILSVTAVFFYKACRSNEKMERFLMMLTIAILSAIGMGAVSRIYLKQRIPIDQIYETILSSPWLFVALASVIIFLFLMKTGKLNLETGRRFFALRCIFLTAVGLAIVIVAVLFVLHGTGYFPDSPIANYFHFNKWWGNSRGFIWQTGGSVFADFNLWGKLFGCGPDNFTPYAYALMGEEINTFWQNQLLPNVHNEWLGGYLNYGLLGGTAYLLFFSSAAVRFMRKSAGHPASLGAFLGVICYMVHNILCYQQVIGASLIFIVIGIGERSIRESCSQNTLPL